MISMAGKKSLKSKQKLTKRRYLKNDIFNHPLGKGSWKDFFIPHSGNDHKPHALHPKRAFFHISVALVIKGLLMLVVLQYPLTAWMTPDVSAAEGKRIITLTNNLRAGLSLNTLAENQKLNQAAYQKVQDMFLQQYFAHYSPTGIGLKHWASQGGYTNYYVLGENLAMGYDNAEDAMTAWRNSPTHYKNLVDSHYRDIGVSISGGQYKGKDAVFIAQYFGALQGTNQTTPPDEPKVSAEKPVTEPPAVLAEQTTPKKTEAAKPAAQVVVSQPAGKPKEKVVEVKANLPATTTKATVEILDQKIALAPQADGQWTGHDVIITDTEHPTIVPPVLTVQDAAGNSTSSDVAADNITPDRASVLEQYSLYKSIPNAWLARLFNLSTIYYEIILVLAMIALALNVAVAHHKQHPHLIASGVGVVMVMFFLILF